MATMGLEEAKELLRQKTATATILPEAFESHELPIFEAIKTVMGKLLYYELELRKKEMSAREFLERIKKNCKYGACGSCNEDIHTICWGLDKNYPAEWDIDKLLAISEELNGGEE